MSTEDQFHVYITGEALEGYELAAAQESFAEKFKLNTEKVQKVFQSPMPFYIKKSIDSKTANAYKKAIHSTGLDGHIEPVVAPKAGFDAMALVSREEQDDSLKQSGITPQIATESKSYATVVEPKETSGAALEILYDVPETALSQEDDHVGIGGWLKFFQVTNVLSLALTTLLFLVGAILTVMEGIDQEGSIALAVDFVGSLPVVVFCILILRTLNDRSEDVPRRISTYLNFKFLATIGVFWLLTVSYYSEFKQPKEIIFGRNMGMVMTMLYCWIWMFYFKRSKRVKEYYNVNNQKGMRADQADGDSIGAYNTQDNEGLAINKGEREFKIPLSAPISALIVILVYAGHAVATSTGNEGVFESLKPISFHVFLLCELALIFLIVYSKKQLDGFLTLYPVIRDRDALVMLRPILKANSYSAMFVMFFLGLGALASIVTIANSQGSEGIIVSGLCLLAMGFMAWYTPSEQKVKQLKCTDESLEEELIAILNKWGGKVVSKS